ncbi:MAG: amino acid permease C-terminal domain-containing protein, partial [Bacteroidota bacterium]
FSSIHPKYKTPGFATIVTGLVVGIPILFTDEKFILDFTSIGTLFAFVLVCGGVLMLPPKEKSEGFSIPYINGKFIVSGLVIVSFVLLFFYASDYFKSIFDMNGENASQNIPMLVFFILCIIMAVLSFIKNLSFIPVAGLISCCYLLTGMAASNWIWFFVWFAIGLVIYFLYSQRKSKLNSANL